MKEKTQTKPAEQLGVRHFLEFVNHGQPDWSLFAVKAAAEEVSEEWTDFRGAKAVHRGVPLKPAGEYDDVANTVAIVQVKNNPWAIVYRSILFVDEAHIELVNEEAKEFSARLNTSAISFVGEDTSGANSFSFFEKGKALEQLEWEIGGQFFKFKSTRRKRPELETVTDEFVDAIFREEGIYVPACYPLGEEEEMWLAVEKSSMDMVERADLIEPEDVEKDEDESGDDEDEDY